MRDDQVQPAFAIVRVDDYFGTPLTAENASTRITVKEIVASQEAADAEIERLNELARTSGGGMFYFAQYTRLALGPLDGDDAT